MTELFQFLGLGFGYKDLSPSNVSSGVLSIKLLRLPLFGMYLWGSGPPPVSVSLCPFTPFLISSPLLT